VAEFRIAVGTSGKPQETFQTDTGPVDLDSGVPAVTLTRPDGSAGPASGAVTHVGAANSGTYQFTLAAQTECTVFKATWTGTVGGQPQTLTSIIEIIGVPLFTIADARAYVDTAGATPLASVALADLLSTRDAITDEFEGICGWSFIPRYAREVYDSWPTWGLLLRHPRALRLISVTVAGVAQDISSLAIEPGGVVVRKVGWQPLWAGGAWGRQNVAIEYVHGWDRTPGLIRLAALRRAAMLLVPSVSSTVSSYTTPSGDTYAFDPAGRRIGAGATQWFGVPAIDSILNRPEFNHRTAVFAGWPKPASPPCSPTSGRCCSPAPLWSAHQRSRCTCSTRHRSPTRKRSCGHAPRWQAQRSSAGAPARRALQPSNRSPSPATCTPPSPATPKHWQPQHSRVRGCCSAR